VITVGLLHTSAAHVPTFEALLPGVRTRHVVDESLLRDAMTGGFADARMRPGGPADSRTDAAAGLRARIAGRLAEAAGEDAAAVLCTCSTIGEVAESLSPLSLSASLSPPSPSPASSAASAASSGVPVLRVDRPMAEAAVRLGGTIGVVATVPSTLGPTEALLREVAEARGIPATLRMLACPEAWPLFERGDRDGYLATIETELRRRADDVDVFVLAQASMAGVAERCADLGVPVLSSPGLAAAELLRRVGVATR
jgi:hypothetical protein